MEIDPALAMEIAALARQRSLHDATASGKSEVQRFYAGKKIFITGGTGFIGKQLIEKLLRACPDVEKIFVLTRPKKSKTVQQRATELVGEALFDSVRKTNPEFMKKICLLQGNITELCLGLSEKDANTVTAEVNIFFHVAATTRFDEPLKSAVLTNVRATREVLTLASKCDNLVAFLHVSTAYSNCPLKEIEEKFYPSPLPYNVLIDLVEQSDEQRLERITVDFVKPWPNTYAFTKAVAEDVIRDLGEKLPTAIVRPAIVAATYREPAPGWLDFSNIFGPSAVIAGSGTGLMHCFLADLNCKVDLVPADFVNNACIVAAFRAAQNQREGENDTKIYNCCSSNRNSVTWASISDICNGYCRWMISPQAIWYCFNVIQPNRYIHLLLTFLWHTLPGFVIDGVCTIIGKKPRFRKIYDRMYKLNNLLSYFCLQQWTFNDINIENLHKNLNETDKEIFQFDIATLDWKEYIQIWYLGIRRYIVKDGLKDTKIATKRQVYFRFLHYVLMAFYLFAFWKIIVNLYSGVMWISNLLLCTFCTY